MGNGTLRNDALRNGTLGIYTLGNGIEGYGTLGNDSLRNNYVPEKFQSRSS